jgi:hypothetical protein
MSAKATSAPASPAWKDRSRSGTTCGSASGLPTNKGVPGRAILAFADSHSGVPEAEPGEWWLGLQLRTHAGERGLSSGVGDRSVGPCVTTTRSGPCSSRAAASQSKLSADPSAISISKAWAIGRFYWVTPRPRLQHDCHFGEARTAS